MEWSGYGVYDSEDEESDDEEEDSDDDDEDANEDEDEGLPVGRQPGVPARIKVRANVAAIHNAPAQPMEWDRKAVASPEAVECSCTNLDEGLDMYLSGGAVLEMRCGMQAPEVNGDKEIRIG